MFAAYHASHPPQLPSHWNGRGDQDIANDEYVCCDCAHESLVSSVIKAVLKYEKAVKLKYGVSFDEARIKVILEDMIPS